MRIRKNIAVTLEKLKSNIGTHIGLLLEEMRDQGAMPRRLGT